MAFMFPSSHADMLDSPERLRILPVERLLEVLGMKPGMRLLDVGCGTGTCFFPAFEAVGGQGVFYAAELQEEMLNRFFNRLEGYQDREGFSDIQVVRAKPDRLPLPDACVDRILMVQVYHEIKNRPAYLQRLSRLLVPGGRLVLIDWRTAGEEPALAEGPFMGPPLDHRISEKEAVAELQDAGFSLVVAHSGFEHNWCLSVVREDA